MFLIDGHSSAEYLVVSFNVRTLLDFFMAYYLVLHKTYCPVGLTAIAHEGTLKNRCFCYTTNGKILLTKRWQVMN